MFVQVRGPRTSSCDRGSYGARRRRILLLFRPQQLAVALVIPHGVAGTCSRAVRLMHVTAHALCGRHGAAELMADGMSLLVLRDRLVPGEEAGVPVLGPRSGGADRQSFACDVAARAAAGAVVARMFVRAEERQMRIVEADLVQVDEAGDAASRSAAAVAERMSASTFFAEAGFGLPISGGMGLFVSPPRSNARKYSPGWKISQRQERHEHRQRTLAIWAEWAGRPVSGSAGCPRGCNSRGRPVADQTVGVETADSGRRHRAARNGGDLLRMAIATCFLGTRRSPGFMN